MIGVSIFTSGGEFGSNLSYLFYTCISVRIDGLVTVVVTHG